MSASPTADSMTDTRTGASFANAVRENLASSVVFVSARDLSVLVSPEGARLLGFGEDRTGLRDVDLPPTLLGFARQGLAGCAITARRIELFGGPGGINVDLSVVPLRDGTEIQGVLLILNDVTQATAFEAHLHYLNRLANVGVLTAGMSHEIKNALVACKTFVDLLLEQNKDHELADVVRREVTRMTAIVGGILKVAGPHQSFAASGLVHLHELIERLLKLLEPELENRDVRVEQGLLAASDTVRGDEYKLEQALLNLLLNALEATPPGGKISVRSELPASAEGESRPDQICICVADSGDGIAPQDLPRLFEPFFTTKPGGTGLGLAITRSVLMEHGGSIRAISLPAGSGASFEILLPLTTADEASAAG